MNRDDLRRRIAAVSREEFSRSGGPGGQNVNKLNTQVTLSVPIAALGLAPEQEVRVRDQLGTRINSEGELVIHAAETRSQLQNRTRAVDRATSLIDAARRPQRRRKPTQPTRASRERRRQAKEIRGRRKQERRPPETW
ncbi:MAG: alternative ribosome rescue aminoacyl-tRNA hydrolase ArfB [Alkalispirochaeta sp.]